ncbi:MAG: hypothetical protein ABJF23_01655 [Bryobacteraceae bacterium]
MANFCVKCGGALNAGSSFCQQCGSPVSGGAAPVQDAPPVYAAPPAPLPPAKSSSVLPFLLIAFLVCAVLGVAALAGVYYYAKAKVTEKMADFKEKTGVDVGAALEKAAQSKPYRGERRDGCLMLTKQEAERILGMPLERVDGGSRGSEEHCDYYAPASAAKASAEQAESRLKALGKSNLKDDDVAGHLKEIEGVVKSMGAAVNDGTIPIMVVTFYRGDAMAAITGLNLGTALSGGVKPEKVPGPWDEAVMGPLNALMTVRKGDNGFMIDLRQLPEGREKGIEIAKTIIDRF